MHPTRRRDLGAKWCSMSTQVKCLPPLPLPPSLFFFPPRTIIGKPPSQASNESLPLRLDVPNYHEIGYEADSGDDVEAGEQRGEGRGGSRQTPVNAQTPPPQENSGKGWYRLDDAPGTGEASQPAAGNGSTCNVSLAAEPSRSSERGTPSRRFLGGARRGGGGHDGGRGATSGGGEGSAVHPAPLPFAALEDGYASGGWRSPFFAAMGVDEDPGCSASGACAGGVPSLGEGSFHRGDGCRRLGVVSRGLAPATDAEILSESSSSCGTSIHAGDDSPVSWADRIALGSQDGSETSKVAHWMLEASPLGSPVIASSVTPRSDGARYSVYCVGAPARSSPQESPSPRSVPAWWAEARAPPGTHSEIPGGVTASPGELTAPEVCDGFNIPESYVDAETRRESLEDVQTPGGSPREDAPGVPGEDDGGRGSGLGPSQATVPPIRPKRPRRRNAQHP